MPSASTKSAAGSGSRLPSRSTPARSRSTALGFVGSGTGRPSSQSPRGRCNSDLRWASRYGGRRPQARRERAGSVSEARRAGTRPLDVRHGGRGYRFDRLFALPHTYDSSPRSLGLGSLSAARTVDPRPVYERLQKLSTETGSRSNLDLRPNRDPPDPEEFQARRGPEKRRSGRPGPPRPANIREVRVKIGR